MTEFFSTLNDAVKGMLVEAVESLKNTGVTYAVIGGWAPFLRNVRTDIQHPGTRDVDLLFSGADVKGVLGKAVQALLASGFIVSGKHDFQVMKAMKVHNREMIFHVDLLHPGQPGLNPELFCEHFDLGVPIDEAKLETKLVKSIVLPSSKFIFEQRLYDRFEVEHPLTKQRVGIDLINQAGLIFSKCESVQAKKRERDAFDIFLATAQPDWPQTIKALISAVGEVGGLADPLKSLYKYLSCEDKAKLFDTNVSKFTKNTGSPSPAAAVRTGIESILARGM